MIKAVIFDLSGVLICLRGEGDFEIIEDNFEFAKKLSNKYKIGILSNLSSDYVKKLKEKEFYNIFDVVDLSGKTGIAKPKEKSYFLILEKLEVNPEETVFIDDSLENIKIAKKLGINSIFYQNHENLRQELGSMEKKFNF